VFHAPSFGDEDFELTATTTVGPSTAASDGGQQTYTTVDHLQSGSRHDDDDKSPTSPDTGCWSSPDVSRSPSCEVEPRRHRFQQVGRPGGDDADICMLKLPAPDEFYIPDIRYSEFYRRSHLQQQQSLNLPAVAYTTPPPLPRYPAAGYGAVMRPAGSKEQCVLLDGGRMPLRCDRGAYTTPAVEYGAPGGGVCYNGAGVSLQCDNSSSTTDMLLRQDTVRAVVSATLQHVIQKARYLDNLFSNSNLNVILTYLEFHCNR